MTACKPLSRWDEAVSAYLTNRRALGRRYRREERILNDVRAFLVHEGRVCCTADYLPGNFSN